jgi:hypothetical protein
MGQVTGSVWRGQRSRDAVPVVEVLVALKAGSNRGGLSGFDTLQDLADAWRAELSPPCNTSRS